ncbi:MAG: IS3 family transposase, partial [bacterium]|nr:IS3 family transposase [bacterium]
YMQYYNHERKQWTRKRMTPVDYRNHLLTQTPRV